jgi:hypothetical protein
MRLVMQRIEDQRGFARTRHSHDNGQAIAELYVHIFEVVFGGTMNPNIHRKPDSLSSYPHLEI